jgi:hypothetical protein
LLRQVAKTTGKNLPELQTPQFPDRIGHVWTMFSELHKGRSYTDSGPCPLTYEGMYAWDRLTRTDLKDWEVRAIKKLDDVWLAVVNEDSKR